MTPIYDNKSNTCKTIKGNHDPLISRAVCAVFLALVLLGWLALIESYFAGFAASISFFGILLLNNFLKYSGDNIALVTGADYFVLVIMFWAYKHEMKELEMIAFFVVLLKLLLCGAEFLFDVLLLPFIPLVFNALLKHMPFRIILKDACKLAAGIIAASCVALGILFLQVTLVTQSFDKTIKHFTERVAYRTFATVTIHGTDIYYNNQLIGTDAWDFLYKYLHFVIIGNNDHGLNAAQYIALLASVSVLIVIIYRRNHQRKLLALLGSTWASLCCPLVWITLARGHAIETGTDRFVWNLPFSLLAFVLIAETARQGYIEVMKCCKSRTGS